MENQSSWRQRWQQFVQSSFIWLFVVIVTAGMTLILSFNQTSDIVAVVGQPATNNLFAPRQLTYTSELLTQQAQDNASDNVPIQYTPFDSSIGRTQLNLARAFFSFVDVVRADNFAAVEQKLLYFAAVELVNVDESVGQDLLELTTADYELARAEVLNTIDALMRQVIRPDQLREYQQSARRSSPSLTQRQENVVTNLAWQFITPTVFPHEEATNEMRVEAEAAVQPVLRTIDEGQLILRAGEEVTELDVETLTEFGLMQPEQEFDDVATMFIASLFSVVILMLYWQEFQSQYYDNRRYLTALAGLWLLFITTAKLMLSGTLVLQYWLPISTFSMLLAVIFDLRLSLIATMITAALVGFIAPNSLELTLYLAAGGIMAVLNLRDAERINAFFRAGLVAALGHSLIILLFRLSQDVVPAALIELLIYSLTNGILSSALTLVGFFILGSLFGITTTLQLQELSRLDHPLLQELLRRAPGTYHHSIMVANLAEQAAEQIDANGTLVRVGAFYHDIGKMNDARYFTENQEGINPHDGLDAYESGTIIIKHVTDGLRLARRYRLPDRIRGFIAEHHGRRLVKGFYHKAKEQAEGNGQPVDEERFRYPGPRPRSRESGLVMLADAIESTSRALQPNSEKAIEKLVNSLIDEDLIEGQLDQSGLTLGDIYKVRKSFIKTLKGRFHVRVKYPGNEALEVVDEPVAGSGTADLPGEAATSS